MSLQKRSLALSGHRTSIALEPEFWAALEAIAAARRVSLPGLVGSIDDGRMPGDGLASALRVFILKAVLPTPHIFGSAPEDIPRHFQKNP